jgi:hypothetical protein
MVAGSCLSIVLYNNNIENSIIIWGLPLLIAG